MCSCGPVLNCRSVSLLDGSPAFGLLICPTTAPATIEKGAKLVARLCPPGFATWVVKMAAYETTVMVKDGLAVP